MLYCFQRYTKFVFCMINKKRQAERRKTAERKKMKLFVCRKQKKNGEGTYLCLIAKAEWGQTYISFDEKNILLILPAGINHREIGEEGVCIGEIRK